MSKNVSKPFILSVDMRVRHRQIPQYPSEENECSIDPVVLPIPSCRSDCECPNCGEAWNDGDEWTKRTIEKQSRAVHQSIGDLYRFTCPNCDEETFECVSDVTDT